MQSWASNTEGYDAQFKATTGQINVDEAEGIVECFVAAIGNKDSVGDIILPGAFNASLRRRKPRVVWGHNWNEPIGKVLEIYEVGPTDPRVPRKMREAGVGGLYARVQFNLKAERGRQAFLDVSFFGEDQEWSVGYKTLEADYDNLRKANLLKQIELYEVSPVLHGANQLTGTLSIKTEEGDDRTAAADTDTGHNLKLLTRALAKTMGGAVRIRGVRDGRADFEHLADNDDYPTRRVVPFRRVNNEYMFGPSEMMESDEGWDEDETESEEEGGIANSEYETSPRQRDFYEAIEDVVEKFGRFDQSTGPEGAHYVEKSPFAKEGLVCSNCLFYSGGRSCEVVKGDIDPDGICKLWQIPADLVKGDESEKGGPDGEEVDPSVDKDESERAEMVAFLRRRLGMENENPSTPTEEKAHGGCGCGGGCGGGRVKPQGYGSDGDDVDEVLEEARSTQQSALARQLSSEMGMPVLVRSATRNTVVFDVMTPMGKRTMRSSWHAERGEIMVGSPEPVREETVFLPLGGGDGQVYKGGSGSEVKAPQDVVLDLPQEAFTGEVLRGYGPRRGNLERLLRYWRPIMRKPGGFRRCRVILANHPELYPLENICAWLHHETTGLWPNEGCHHPGMKNCRRKLRGVVRGSIWSDREWNDRLRKLTGKKKGLGYGWVYDDQDEFDEIDYDSDSEDVFEQMLIRGRAELIKFCKNEPEFATYLSKGDNWYVEGDMDDGSLGEHPVMKEYCADCDDEKSAMGDDWLSEVTGLIGGISEKAGRALSGRNLNKLRQALLLLQEVVAAGGEPLEIKAPEVKVDLVDGEVFIGSSPEALFDLKSFIDPIVQHYGLDSEVKETGIFVQGSPGTVETAYEALATAITGYLHES